MRIEAILEKKPQTFCTFEGLALLGFPVSFERVKGFEPSTTALGRQHSTTELHPHWGSFRSRFGSRAGLLPTTTHAIVHDLYTRAGKGIRTLDIHLGKVALYH